MVPAASGQVAPPSRAAAVSGLRPPLVPPELEEICLKALSRDKKDRYASAAELAADVQRYLDGALECERREKLAAVQVAEAERRVARCRDLSRRAREVRERALGRQLELSRGASLELKIPVWDLQDEAARLEGESRREFADAESALTSALSNVPSHAVARKLRAELAWERFLEAEEAGSRPEMLAHRRVAEAHNDGALDEVLRDDGTLAVETCAFTCACLKEGRLVRPEELDLAGYHPFSGRSAEDPGDVPAPELEPRAPARLRVHGPNCASRPVPGTRVWAFRYEEIHRILVPVTPREEGPRVPEAALDRLFGDSPFRPRGGGMFLGETPVAPRRWPMGPWLLVAVPPAAEPARLPVFLRRGERLDARLTLFQAGDIPGGLLPVAGGAFPARTDRPATPQWDRPVLALGDFFLARFPVTCAEYAAFLNDLERGGGDAASRAPRRGDGELCWPRAGGEWIVPARDRLARLAPEARAAAATLLYTREDWEDDWPVLGISFEDAAAFAAWRTRRDGFAFHLPRDEQWERAARGADARLWPWGNAFDQAMCNMTSSLPGPMRPVSVRDFPRDESPFGVRGLGGNASDYCLDLVGPNHPGLRSARGGAWAGVESRTSTIYRGATNTRGIAQTLGIRLAAAVRLPERWGGSGREGPEPPRT
jgi:formylglycine-generating enzyme required for sulfatase activity